jgi:hypothetical protein
VRTFHTRTVLSEDPLTENGTENVGCAVGWSVGWLVGAAVGEYGLGGGFWTVLIAALVGGFAPIIAYRLWKWSHHKLEP